MFFTTLPNIKNISSEFDQFIKNSNIEINDKLSSKQIIDISIIVEKFICEKFSIFLEQSNKNQDFISIKRQFVQRIVYQKYHKQSVKESWENEYNFINEDQFIEDAQNPTEEIERYTAFAIFTENGKKKHKNDNIFQIPKKINEFDNFLSIIQNNVTAKEIQDRKDFNLTDKFPSDNHINWHLNYCLHCHKRGKDTCSKGLNEFNVTKNGCPLKQDISESIWLKKEGFIIAPLVAIMRNNPLCILTGRRICNDCEAACIFQQQEAVDIESIETKILNDVLLLPFGLEIYNLLLHWNPLNIENFNLKGKSVMVAGLGPAGIFASYIFAKNGANVYGMDALSIQTNHKIDFIKNNIIQDLSPLLNENLESRVPSNIGGVMEYGITVRWNKNYLDILIGLLLRMPNILFRGSMRIGFNINYDDIFNHYKFNHVALCVGSATPKLPFNIKNLFSNYSLTKGVIMASDFLMSLHINKKSDFLKNFVKNPVYIIGCGLTAIDVACEARALLLAKNIKIPQVKIIYYDQYNKSSSYKLNHLEFKKALEEGVEIIQNTKIVEIITKDENIDKIILENGEEMQCSTLILAVGTQPNIAHIKEFIDKNAVSFFGDCNPQYTGSVVKAMASVKDNINLSMEKILKNQNILQNIDELTKEINIKIEENAETGFYKIEITNLILSKKSKIGDVLKLQAFAKNSIAVTICEIQNDKMICYLQNSNDETNYLINEINNNSVVFVNGPNCTSILDVDSDTIIIATEKVKFILEKIYKNYQFVLPNNKMVFYKEKKYLIAIEDEGLQNEILLNAKQNVDMKNINVIVYNKMNCMLGGICGRCVKPDGKYNCF